MTESGGSARRPNGSCGIDSETPTTSVGPRSAPPSGRPQCPGNPGLTPGYVRPGQDGLVVSEEGGHELASPGKGLTARYVVGLYRFRWIVLLGWLCLACGMSYPAMTFMQKTSQAFNALPGTQSLKAQETMTHYFPDQGTVTNVIVYLRSLNASLPDHPDQNMLVSRPGLAKFDDWMQGNLSKRFGKIGPGAPLIPMYESYWSLAKMGLQSQALGNLVSSDGVSTFIAVSINALSTDQRSTDVANAMSDIVDANSALLAAAKCEATPLGLPSFMSVIVSSAEANLGTIDAISIPLAMCVLMYVLRSCRLLIVPLINMGATAAVSFGVMSLVADHMMVNSVAPSLMMSILVAMSIDYSLFLCSRYRDEVRQRKPMHVVPRAGSTMPRSASPGSLANGYFSFDVPKWRVQCVEQMVGTAGETIAVSALTLGVCFLALLVFPMNFIQSIGLANAITIFIALSSNIMITPAMFFAFHGFFEKCTEPGECFGKQYCTHDDSSDEDTDSDGPEGDETPPRPGSPGMVIPSPRHLTGGGLESPLASPPHGDRGAALYDPCEATRVTVPRLHNIQQAPRGRDTVSGSSTRSSSIRSIVTGKTIHTPRGGLKLFWWRWSELVLPVRPERKSAQLLPWNWVLLVGIVAATVWFDLFAFNNAHTDAMDLFLPRGAQVTNAYSDMADRFGLGKIYPITTLIVLNEDAKYPLPSPQVGVGASVLNDEFYDDARRCVIDTVIDRAPWIGAMDIISPMYAGGENVSYTFIETCKTMSGMLWEGWSPSGADCKVGPEGSKYPYHPSMFNPNTTRMIANMSGVPPGYIQPCNDSTSCMELEIGLCQACQALISTNTTFTSADGRAVYMYLNPETDPLGVNGQALHDALIDLRAEFETCLDAKVYFAGYNAITWETVEKIFGVFPLMIVLEGVVVFIILGTVFRSFFIPLRAIGTIGLTLAWTFGLCDLVYEHNILGWTGIAAWKGTGAVEWTNSIVLFSMVVGIGLDYDIFLLTRIKEYHNEGVPTREAIRQGLCDTGRIITAAGIIMAVAFSGLFVSSIPVLNQMGFYLVFSVVFETFVVESILSPAIMGLIGELNWWPQGASSCCAERKEEARQLLQSYHHAQGRDFDSTDGEATPRDRQTPSRATKSAKEGKSPDAPRRSGEGLDSDQ